MIRIQVPATSANLGTGFDCLGVALSIYNRFDVELSDTDILENTEERFKGPDNLFLRAFHKGCDVIGTHSCVKAVLHCEIPASRGLGSSAAMITGGLYAASVLHDHALSKEQIFTLAAEMEHHPDNASPAVFGGLTACLDMKTMRTLPLSDDLCFTVLIPDFEVPTEKARQILPASYLAADTFTAISRAVLTVRALEDGDITLLQQACKDLLHEPYRRTLIPDFDLLKELVMNDTPGVFLISGSGSTCLFISKNKLSDTVLDEINKRSAPSWKVLTPTVDRDGVTS